MLGKQPKTKPPYKWNLKKSILEKLGSVKDWKRSTDTEEKFFSLIYGKTQR